MAVVATNILLPSRIFHTCTPYRRQGPSEGLINTVALARCQNVLWTGQLFQFQQFVTLGGKPLKRLGGSPALWHRAKATVLMRGGSEVRKRSWLPKLDPPAHP